MSKKKDGKNTKRNSYPEEYKQGAVKAALVNGVSITARDLGIPRTTIQNWINRHKEQVDQPEGQQKREYDRDGDAFVELVDNFTSIAKLSSARIIQLLEDPEAKISFRDLGIVLGVSTDKLISLNGGKVSENDRSYDVKITVSDNHKKPASE